MPSPKILAKKKKVVADLTAELKKVDSIVISDYKGLNVAQDTEMRAAFRKEGVTYRIVKNSTLVRVFENFGITDLGSVLTGPTAIAYSEKDVVTAPRLVKKYADQFRKTKIKGGILDGESVEAEVVETLASIPPMDQLYGQLVSVLMYPITRLAITSNLIAEKLAENGETPVADAAAAPEEPAADETKTDEEKTEEKAVEQDDADKPAAPANE